GKLLLTGGALLGHAAFAAAAQLIAQRLQAPPLLLNEFVAQALRSMCVRLRDGRGIACRKAFLGGLVDQPFAMLWIVRAGMSGHVHDLQGVDADCGSFSFARTLSNQTNG